MPTLWSKSLIPTARHVPAEAVVPSHQLMLRAGLIRQLGAGTYDYLPLGWRALMKAIAIVREEMDKAGAVEVFLPTLHPIELWEQTGRRAAYGENLFVITDRHGRQMALGPTHEEVMTDLVKAYVESYRQLPLTLYQIQTKFRDEYRPRFGVLRSREFQMKDAYSFDMTREGLDKSYQAMYDAYIRIFHRCGIPIRIVEAESGPIGGSASHEFMVPSPTGEDVILESDKGNYAANVEKCEIGTRPVSATFASISGRPEGSAQGHPPPAPTGALEKVHTPECPGIDDVCKFMKVKAKHMLKTLVFHASSIADAAIDTARRTERNSGPGTGSVDGGLGFFVIVVLRGDHDVNEAKLRSYISTIQPTIRHLALADVQLARQAGFQIGFVGPHAGTRPDSILDTIVVDPDATIDQFWVTGANEVDHHVKHFNWKRDVLDPLGPDAASRIKIADIRNAVEGDPSPKNDGGVLRSTKGIEIGHVFKLGTKYSDALDLKVVDEKNERQAVIMGCYGIGVNRILASAIERMDGDKKGHDENGIIWPAAIAPYQVVITPIKYEGEQKAVADQIAAKLSHAQSPVGPLSFFHPDVLIDDRDERPGVKFKDADLIGFPVRITIGDKALKEGKVEVKARTAAKAELVPIDDAVKRVLEMLATM